MAETFFFFLSQSCSSRLAMASSAPLRVSDSAHCQENRLSLTPTPRALQPRPSPVGGWPIRRATKESGTPGRYALTANLSFPREELGPRSLPRGTGGAPQDADWPPQIPLPPFSLSCGWQLAAGWLGWWDLGSRIPRAYYLYLHHIRPRLSQPRSQNNLR